MPVPLSPVQSNASMEKQEEAQGAPDDTAAKHDKSPRATLLDAWASSHESAASASGASGSAPVPPAHTGGPAPTLGASSVVSDAWGTEQSWQDLLGIQEV